LTDSIHLVNSNYKGIGGWVCMLASKHCVQQPRQIITQWYWCSILTTYIIQSSAFHPPSQRLM